MSQTSGRLGRVLALDLGDARIGVAVSDPEGRVAVPLATVQTGAPADSRAIGELVLENDVVLVVVGHPLKLSGERGTRAEMAEQFAATLREALPVPVELHDERLSTVEAERGLREAGVRGVRRRRAVDRASATVILQSYLDAARARRPGD